MNRHIKWSNMFVKIQVNNNNNNKPASYSRYINNIHPLLEEAVGFEPTERSSRPVVFKTTALGQAMLRFLIPFYEAFA